MIYYYWFFNHGFEFQDSVSNGCHDLTMVSVNISNIAIITVKNVDYRCIIHSISKSEANNVFKNSVFEDCGKDIKRYRHKFQSIQNRFFYFFCLVYMKG